MRVLVNEKLCMSHLCVPAAQKANCILGCIEREVAGGGRDCPPLLCPPEGPSALWHPSLRFPARERHGVVRVIQRRAAKVIRVLEHLSYKEGLRELGLLSLEKRRLHRDIAAFQYLRGSL